MTEPANTDLKTSTLPHTAAAIARKSLTIVAFGSSTTEGVGASRPENTYPARLAMELTQALPGVRVTVLNRGQGGEEAEDLAGRVPDVIADRPDLVIFQTGTNDALREVPLKRFLELTRDGLDAFRAAGIDVMLMEPQYCRAMLDAPHGSEYVQAMRDLGAAYAVPVNRRHELMRGWLESGRFRYSDIVTEDDLHMADAGYAALARAVADQILALAQAR
ncbi:MAG TPA: SGNH/GDSL hydrolase family protein [Alphaproteobacteria bacterium]|jgi:acyl-CoA thioesterase-1|nr:SGNH/GDSL hydrolase family protein [Alphaproteobacteria bacterium]